MWYTGNLFWLIMTDILTNILSLAYKVNPKPSPLHENTSR